MSPLRVLLFTTHVLGVKGGRCEGKRELVISTQLAYTHLSLEQVFGTYYNEMEAEVAR